jgi:hypothetical protein
MKIQQAKCRIQDFTQQTVEAKGSDINGKVLALLTDIYEDMGDMAWENSSEAAFELEDFISTYYDRLERTLREARNG